MPRLPVDKESISFKDWLIDYRKSHILKSICRKGQGARCQDEEDGEDFCELCLYQKALELPHLPDMVFHKNRLSLQHKGGACLYFEPMDALRLVENGKQNLEVACAQEWKENRYSFNCLDRKSPFPVRFFIRNILFTGQKLYWRRSSNPSIGRLPLPIRAP